MKDQDEHRRLRELLGTFALGDLPADESAALRAHLDGCAACRAELAELVPLAAALRDVDPDADALSSVATPPADLGERIRASVAAERELVEARERRTQRRTAGRRGTRRAMAAAAVVAVAAGALGAGTVLGRTTAQQPQAVPAPSASALPSSEQVALRTAAGVEAVTATLVPHTWGVEARFEGSGFAVGRVYRAAFRDQDGRMVPAGEFLGTGGKVLRCNMQSALLREDATAFVVVDEAGAEVLTASL